MPPSNCSPIQLPRQTAWNSGKEKEKLSGFFLNTALSHWFSLPHSINEHKFQFGESDCWFESNWLDVRLTTRSTHSVEHCLFYDALDSNEFVCLQPAYGLLCLHATITDIPFMECRYLINSPLFSFQTELTTPFVESFTASLVQIIEAVWMHQWNKAQLWAANSKCLLAIYLYFVYCLSVMHYFFRALRQTDILYSQSPRYTCYHISCSIPHYLLVAPIFLKIYSL